MPKAKVFWTKNIITLDNILYLDVIIINNGNKQKKFEHIFMVIAKTKLK